MYRLPTRIGLHRFTMRTVIGLSLLWYLPVSAQDASTTDSQTEKGRALFAEANNYLMTMPARALNTLQNNLPFLQYLSPEEQFDWYFATYRAAKSMDKSAIATQALESLVEYDVSQFRAHKQVSLLSALGIYFREHQAFAQAGRAFQCAISQSVTIDQKLALSVSLALIFRFQADYESATTMYEAVIRKAKQVGATVHQANGNNNLGVVLLMKGEPLAAAPHFAQALEYNQLAGRRSAMTNSGINLLLSYLLSGQKERYLRLDTRVEHMIKGSTNQSKQAYYAALQVLNQASQQGGADEKMQADFLHNFANIDDYGIQTILARIAPQFGMVGDLPVFMPEKPLPALKDWFEAQAICQQVGKERLSAQQLAADLLATR
ncbi:hypothetical protein [Bowmanella denitrificans]|uniref:hypothetical protein n=1 Tax=Bowmanella denitrificans TaxID=366582 RepID=UPI0011AF1BEE|nr:hypothetical protein [Bowmanella denitrificans]